MTKKEMFCSSKICWGRVVFTIAAAPLLMEVDLVCQRDQMLPAIEDVWSIQRTISLDILPWWGGRVCGSIFLLSGLLGWPWKLRCAADIYKDSSCYSLDFIKHFVYSGLCNSLHSSWSSCSSTNRKHFCIFGVCSVRCKFSSPQWIMHVEWLKIEEECSALPSSLSS